MQISKVHLLFVIAVLSVFSCKKNQSFSSASEYLDSVRFSGTVLITENGRDLLRTSYGYADKEAGILNEIQTRFRIGSLSKAFTSLCIVQLQNEGQLNYDDPLSNFVSFPEGDRITVRSLLTHQSGLDDYLKYVDERTAYTPEELLDLVKDRPLLSEPGTDYYYSNTNYVLLGLIIESLSGMSYAEYINRKITTPLGMINTEYGNNYISGELYAKGYQKPSQNRLASFHDISIPFSAGALSSNIGDMELWANSFLDYTLIDENDSLEIFDGCVLSEDCKYGFAWFITSFNGRTAYRHEGSINGFNTAILIVPENRGIIIALSNIDQPSVTVKEMVTRMAEIELER